MEPQSDKRAESRGVVTRGRVRRRLLSAALAASVAALGVILWIEPSYLAHGAWRGYYDMKGDPSPVEQSGGRMLLLGYENDEGVRETPFDITGTLLDRDNIRRRRLRYNGLDLVQPYYSSNAPAEHWDPIESWLPYMDTTLVVHIGDDVRVFPTNRFMGEQVINDVIGGVPVLIVYSGRIRLAAVFERVYGGRLHTFSQSGHLYYEDRIWSGLYGMLLWDLNTDSLWWPQGGKAVSGVMKGTPMRVLDQDLWALTSWQEIKARYPEVKMMDDLQNTIDYDAPWPRYEDNPAELDRFGWGPKGSRPPRWGENASMPGW